MRSWATEIAQREVPRTDRDLGGLGSRTQLAVCRFTMTTMPSTHVSSAAGEQSNRCFVVRMVDEMCSEQHRVKLPV
jgi:hypothetical protein